MGTALIPTRPSKRHNTSKRSAPKQNRGSFRLQPTSGKPGLVGVRSLPKNAHIIQTMAQTNTAAFFPVVTLHLPMFPWGALQTPVISPSDLGWTPLAFYLATRKPKATKRKPIRVPNHLREAHFRAPIFLQFSVLTKPVTPALGSEPIRNPLRSSTASAMKRPEPWHSTTSTSRAMMPLLRQASLSVRVRAVCSKPRQTQTTGANVSVCASLFFGGTPQNALKSKTNQRGFPQRKTHPRGGPL